MGGPHFDESIAFKGLRIAVMTVSDTRTVTNWRKARRNGALRGLRSKKPGAKPKASNPLEPKVRELEAKVARLEKDLHKAHIILDVQEKVAGLLGFSLALSANVSETPAHPLITVGRWKVIPDGRREEDDGLGKAPRPPARQPECLRQIFRSVRTADHFPNEL